MVSKTKKRVAVTGLGALCPVGNTIAETWESLIKGQCGIGPITYFDASPLKTRIAGEIKGFEPEKYLDKKAVKRFDLFIQYAVSTAKMAVEDSGLDLSTIDDRTVGCVMGCGLGGLNTIEANHSTLLSKGPDRVSPFFVPMMIANMAPGQVAIELGLKGPNLLLATACAAGTHAVGTAFQYIRDFGYKVMVTGGAEAVITPLAVSGFNAIKALSTRNDDPARASRPFDKDRDGFVLGEGSGMLVLEEWEHAVARGAKIYAEVVGFGASCDAYHTTAPPEDGAGAASAIKAALDDAEASGLKAADIGYINAHGTSTDLNDQIETKAIKDVFGAHAQKLAVSSTKSMTGHLLGAAGGLEAVIVSKALKEGILPPTINLDEAAPGCDLDYIPHQARQQKVTAAISNSFGFGGTNACLAFKSVE